MRYSFAARTFGVLAALVLASCFGDGLGPDSARRANILIAPNFDNRALLVVDVNRVLVRFTHPGTSTVFKEEIADFPAGDDTLELSIELVLDGPSQQFDLTLLLIDDPAGDTLFRSGPTLITAVASTTPTVLPTAVPLYVGPGSQATSIRFVSAPVSVFFGQTVQFVAEALDANNVPVPTAPITYSSSDDTRASIDAASGAATAANSRGSVDIKAELPRTSASTPPAEVTQPLVVQPVADHLVIQGGGGQSGPVGGALQPVTVRVRATDNLGVQGVTVNFAVLTGGGSLSAPSGVTDASGDVSVTWTLGPPLGSQSISATVPGLTGGTVNVPATGVAGPASQLVYSQVPGDGLAGIAMTPAVRVAAQDQFGNPAPAFVGPVSLAITSNPGSATLSGGGPVNAVAGEAIFPAVILSAAGTGYTLTASSAGLTPVTSAAFNMTLAVPTHLVFVQEPTAGSAGAAIAPPVQVAIREVGGNTVPGATDVVTIAIASNPANGTLSGTLSVAAVNGIATFPDLSLDRAGTGYTLSATSGALTAATSAAFDITANAPQALEFVVPPSTGSQGSPIVPAIQVRALDASGNTVTSFTGNISLAFGANPGGATLGGTLTQTAVAGIATFADITVSQSAAGYTVVASSGALTPATSAAFSIAPPGVTKTWAGTVSTDFNDGANWIPAGVPGTSDNVLIPVTANAPVLSAGLTINRLSVTTGATLSVATHTLIAQEVVIVDGAILGGGQLTIAGPPGATLRGTVGNLVIATTVLANGPLTVTGNVASSATFNVNGQSVTVAGDLAIQNVAGARLQMQDPFGSLTVTGSVTFQGDNQSGLLTDGTLDVGGDFIQSSLISPQSFFPTGNFVTRFIGSGTQNVLFDTPGPGAGASRFLHLELAGAGAFSFTQNLFVNGQLRAFSGAAVATSNGSTLNVTGLSVNGLTLTNALLVSNGGTLAAFDNVTFLGYASSATPLTISHPGNAAPFVMNAIAFQVTPTTGGFYLAADDNTADANTLTLELTNATPADGSANDNATGGAVITWVVPIVTRTWTGAVSTAWSDPGNWSPAGVPTAAEIVSIVPAATQPVLDTDASALSVTIAGAGAQLTIGANDLIIGAGGSLTVHTDGLLVMTDPGGVVVVDNANFQGGNETGLLTAGELRVRGSFFAGNQTTPFSFAASGTHRVAMIGTAGLQGVHFQATGTSSGFQNLDISGSPGINIQASIGGVNVFDTLTSRPSGPAPRLYMLGSPLRARRFNVDGLIVDRGTLTLDEAGVAGTQQFDNVTFENYQTTQTQLAMVVQGGGARTMTFNNLAFQPLSAGNTGRYLNIQASSAMTLELPGASPANGPAFTLASGGAVVNWPTAVLTWTGAVSNDWSVAGNWSGGTVPLATSDVIIPGGTPNQPVLVTTTDVAALTIATGAALDIGNFNLAVTGNLDATGGITSTGGGVELISAVPVTLRGILPRVTVLVAGPVDVNGPVTITDNLNLNHPAADFRVNGNTVTIAGMLNVGARITMTNPADVVSVAGNVTFAGGDQTGRLTAGFLLVGGNFRQLSGSSAFSFVSTGTRVHFVGSAAQDLDLDNEVGARFSDIEFAHTGVLTLSANVTATGQLIVTSGAPEVQGLGNTLTVAGLDVAGLVLDNAPLVSVGGTITRFDQVIFQNYPSTSTPLVIRHPGAATPFNFNDLEWLVTPTTGGFYLEADDNDVNNGLPLGIVLIASTPPDGSALDNELNGATITWPVMSSTHTWTGTVSSQWDLGANWSQGVVPPPTEDAVIPAGTPNSPVMSIGANEIRNITVAAGATLDLGSQFLTASGNVDATGPMTGTGGIVMTGASTVRGTMPTLDILNNVTATGPLTLSFLRIGGTNARLTLNGNTVVSATGIMVDNSALLVMTNPADVLQVQGGNALFRGGNQTGFLTAGAIGIGGNFAQGTGTTSFVSTGTTVAFGGGATQTISFAHPASSRFHDVAFAHTGTVELLSDVNATGRLIAGSGSRSIQGNAHTLTVAGLDVAGLVLENLSLVSVGGTITLFDNVTFQGYASTATPLVIRHPGAATPFTFNNTQWLVTPTTGGFYLEADDNDTGNGLALGIVLVGSTPLNGSSQDNELNGATITWPATGTTHTWIGNGSLWQSGSNWSQGVVPPANEDVVIPAGTPSAPLLATAAAVRNISIASGATVNLGTFTLTATGNVDAGGGFFGTGTVVMTGGGAVTLRGSMPHLTVEDDVTVTGLVITGNVAISGASARLRLNGQLVSAAALSVSNDGLVVMTNPADLLQVSFLTSFQGGDQTGFLTAGQIQVNGSFEQSINATAFVSTGTLVRFNGSSPQSISFADPATSRFADVEFGQFAPVTLLTAVNATGVLRSPVGSILSGSGQLLSVSGLDVAGLQLDNLLLRSDGGPITRFDNVIFQNTDVTATALDISHPGAATPFTFSTVSFLYVPDGGLFFRLTDSNPTDGQTLTVTMDFPTPAFSGSFTSTAGGAVLNWPSVASFTWTGAVSGDWNVPGNWSSGIVPTIVDNVTVPVSAPNVATLSTSVSVNDLTVRGTVNLNSSNLTVEGNVDASGGGQVIGAGGVLMGGVGRTVMGTVPNLIVSGSVTAASATTVTGDLHASGGGTFSTGSSAVQVNGIFLTAGNGGLVMTAGSLDVTGDASFSGIGSSLTGGVLTVRGSFVQASGNNTFVASGTHRTVLDGGVPQTVQFDAPGTAQNHFQDLRITGAGGVNFTSNAAIMGLLEQVGVAGNITNTGTRALTVQGGFTKNIGQITVDSLVLSGALTVAGGTYGVTNTVFAGTGQVIPNNFIFAHVFITGTGASFTAGTTDLAGELAVNAGDLTIAPGATVNAAFVNVNGGLLHQTGGTLVTGNILLAGADGGVFSGGVMNVAGNFTQSTNPNNFAASAAHSVVLNGTSQTVTFSHPGLAQSRFQNLNVLGQNVTFAGPVFAAGQLTGALGATLHGGGSTITVSGLGLDSVVVDNLRLVSIDGPSVAMGRVRFVNFPLNVTPLTISHPGAGAPFVFDSLVWDGFSPTAGAFYLDVNDSDGPSVPLTITLTNATPPDGSALDNATNGAVINWQFTAAFTWTGAIDSDWHNQGNWSGAAVPTSTDDVTIPSGPANQPVISSNANVAALTVQPGASVTLSGSALLTASGNVDAGTTVSGTGVLVLDGIGTTLRGTVGSLLISGTTTLSGNLTATDLSVSGTSAQFTVGAHTANVTSFLTQGNSQLVMGPGSLLAVSGLASFAGGDQSGLLVGGTIALGGNFVQSSITSPNSFVSNGTRLVLNGPGNQSLTHEGTPVFAGVEFAGGGTKDITGNMLVLDSLSVLDPITVQGSGSAVVNRKVTTVPGSTLSLNAIAVNADSLQVGGTWAVNLTTVTAGAVLPSLSYTNLQIVGSTAISNPAPVTMTGQLQLAGPTFTLGDLLTVESATLTGGSLVLNGRTAIVTGSGFITTANGLLVMTNPADSLHVDCACSATVFSGPDQTGFLTDGVMALAGSFTQLNLASDNSFVSTGTRVRLMGTDQQDVTFATADSTRSRMADVVVDKPSGPVVFASPAVIMGRLDVATTRNVVSNDPLGLLVRGRVATVVGSDLSATNLIVNVDSLQLGGAFGGLTPTTLTAMGGAVVPNLNFIALHVATGRATTLAAPLTLASASTALMVSGATTELTLPAGTHTVDGGLEVNGFSRLVVNGSTVNVTGPLSTQTGGLIVMINPADQVNVTGDVLWAGGDHSGSLTDGILRVSGNFTQAVTPDAFDPSAAFSTELNGAANQEIQFANPGQGGIVSHFHNLRVTNAAAAVQLLSDVYVTGQLLDGGSGIENVAGVGVWNLIIGGANIDGMSFNAVQVSIGTLAPFVRFDNVTLGGYTSSDIQLSVAGLASETKTFNNLTFSTVLSGGNPGRYVVADGPFSMVLVNPNPASPGGFTNSLNGATIDWGGTLNLWTGGTGSWSTPGNWSKGTVPVAGETVQITNAGTYQVTLDVVPEFASLTVGGVSGLQTLAIPAQETLLVNTGQVMTVGTNGVLSLAGGMIRGSATITVNGAFNWSAGHLTQGGGKLLVNGAATIAGAVDHLDSLRAYTLEIAGTADWTSSHIIQGSAGALRVVPGGVLNVTGSNPRLFGIGPGGLMVLDNEGTINRSVGTAEFFITTAVSGSGAWNVSSGQLGLHIAGTLAGPITITAPGRLVVFDVLLTFGPTSSVSGTGDLEVTIDGQLDVQGSYSLSGTTMTTSRGFGPGTLTFSTLATPAQTGVLVADSGLVVMNNRGLLVSGSLTTSGSGNISMTNANDSIVVGGDATFGGNSQAAVGLLTAGKLRLLGNFTQNTNAQAYQAGAAHITQFGGSAIQTVTFANPAQGASSNFGELSLDKSGGSVDLASAAFAAGQLTKTATPGTINSTNALLTVQGASTTGSLTFNNTRLAIGNGAMGSFDNVTFQNMSPTVTQLSITRSSGTITFTGHAYSTQPSGPGFYLSLNGAFSVTMSGASPANGFSLSQLLGGAALTW